MDYYLNYSGNRLNFTVPSEWTVLGSSDCAEAPVIENVAREIERALDNPIGIAPLETFARPGMKVTVLFDDTQRATPAATPPSCPFCGSARPTPAPDGAMTCSAVSKATKTT